VTDNNNNGKIDHIVSHSYTENWSQKSNMQCAYTERLATLLMLKWFS